MHILHGTWLPDTKQFGLWGEDATAEPRYQKGRRGPRAPHPFALKEEQWLHYLDLYSTESGPTGKRLTILLPGSGKDVQPSPEALAAGMVPPAGELLLLAWEMNALILDPTDVLDLLIQLPLPHEPHTGFVLGSDLFFWQQATLLVMNCLIEQRYLPALEQQGTRFVAHWMPQPDPALVDQLVENMPPLCRAVAAKPSDAPTPRSLLDDFVQTTLDAFIRETHDDRPEPRHPWLKALTGPDRILAGRAKENQKLYETWQSQIFGDTTPGGFRICFRLDEPVSEDDPWLLSYMLQANDDPSLLVDATAVWSATKKTLTYLERRFDNPQEKMLSALGTASQIFPAIERSLREASPTGVALSGEEAYRFLVEAVPLLEQHHFGVLVPNWWARREALKAKAHLAGQANEPSGFLSRDRLIKYQWELSLGDEKLSQAEFEELAALKQPLVRVRGQWIALDPEQIQSALQFLKSQAAEGDLSLLDALKLTADVSASAAPTGLEVETADVEGWLADLLEQVRNPDHSLAPAVPAELHATLRPYQERGFGWLVQMRRLGLGACLADDMGLGKTIQAITFWLHEREVLGVDRPALLVCPTSVVANWRHEIHRFAPSLRVYVHQGAARLSDEDFERGALSSDVVLTSYALLSRDLETLKRVTWSSLILDEAQNIKNPATKQAHAARTLAADHRMALTGTPVENRLTELWSIMQFLNPGYLGAKEVFRSQFSIPIERYGDDLAATTLKKLVTPFVLRRLKTDPTIIDDLPEKFENKVYCSLTAEQATLYEAVVREELEAIEEADTPMARRGNILRMLTRLKQICNHPAHFLKDGSPVSTEPFRTRSGKLARLTEMLEEVYSTEDRALIFTQYAEMGKYLQAYLRECFTDEVLFLYGDTPAPKREEMIRQFQAPKGPTVFVLSLKAGGTGLNLTHANHVFHFDRWYNPAVENQATDRAFRIGQTRNVQVHKFICAGTLEERIDELIEHKQGLADKIVGEGEGWISEMSTDEIRDLVTLRREMVEETV